MSNLNVSVKDMIQSLQRRTADFLLSEMDLSIDLSPIMSKELKKLELWDVTSIISLGGDLQMLVAFSFDHSLIHHLFDMYSEELGLAQEDKEICFGEIAGDIINNIVGNATADFQYESSLITVTPPVIITDARSLIRHKKAEFVSVILKCDKGSMQIFCVVAMDINELKILEK